MGYLTRTVSVMVLIAASSIALPASAEALRGVALVIGAADYESLTDLANPLNDARAMDEMLSDLGFEVTRVLDRGADRMRREIEDFLDDAEGADVALVYFAGHAVEAAGQNFLVPVDADLSTPLSAGQSLVPVAELLDELSHKVPVTVMLLDACRTEAFPDGTAVLLPGSDAPIVASATGLIEMRGPTPVLANIPPESLGMVIGFAAAPGQAALDGPPGTNSPYAAALLKHLGAGGFAFGDLMTMVTEEVYLRTGARQVPWTNSSLRRVLSFEAVEDTGDDEALIRDGRRRLLLSISATPTEVRQQVEAAADQGGVPMDTLYGLLDALGEAAPSDPGQLDQLLRTQTETIRRVMAERETLTSTDGEIVRLADLAQRALDEGALEVSVGFWEQAKARYSEISANLDATEAMLRERRLEGGALLARTGYAYGLSGDYRTAAENFRLGYAEVERWDDAAALEYKQLEAESIYLLGVQGGDNSALAEAAGIYREALGLAPAKGRQWALIQREIGNSYAQLASRDANDASVIAAVEAYDAALEVFDRGREPLEWAMVQTRRAAVLSIKGEREPHGETLEAVIESYQAALEVLSPEHTPYEWAIAQNNLGTTLMTLGARQSGPESLSAGIAAFRAALTQTSEETQPFSWALTQVNLAAALLLLGTRSNDPQLLAESIDSLHGALARLPRDRVPLQWARAYGNLGAALLRKGELEGSAPLMEEAVAALRAALDEFTPERALLDWSTATTNLGNALTFLARERGDERYLLEAAAAYRATATALGREQAPLQWAQAQNNLGATLLLLGESSGGMPVYLEALEAVGRALEIWTRDRVPLDWAMARRNAGHVYVNIAIMEEGTAALEDAVRAYRDAAEELTRERSPSEWANLQYRLGGVQLELALRDPAQTQWFIESVAAYDAALTIYTREADALSWADVANGRAWALASGGYNFGDRDMLRAARAQMEAVRDVVLEAGIPGQDEYLANRLAIIDSALAEISGQGPPN